MHPDSLFRRRVSDPGVCQAFGFGLALGMGGRVDAGLDPSSLALTGWYRASYSGAPWVGTASAGTSGAKSATSPGSAPTVGTAVNGKTPALYNGTTEYLRDIVSTGPDYISTTKYRVVMLIEPGTLSAPAGAPYDDRGLFVETGGNWGIYANISA